MESQIQKRQKLMYLLLDIVQMSIAFLAAIVLTLDSTGLIALPWLKENLSELTFSAICLLIFVSAVERRFTIHSFVERMENKLNDIEKQSKLMHDSLSGAASIDMVFTNRDDFTPLEHRLKNTKDVWFSGQSLIGLVSAHHSLFRKLAKDKYRFRFLLEDPSHCIEKNMEEIHRTLTLLTSIKQSSPSQIEIRLTSEVLHYSLLLLDSKSQIGRIQVEFYEHGITTSDRPHIVLQPGRDPKWYQFYQDQFESLWNSAQIYKNDN